VRSQWLENEEKTGKKEDISITYDLEVVKGKIRCAAEKSMKNEKKFQKVLDKPQTGTYTSQMRHE